LVAITVGLPVTVLVTVAAFWMAGIRPILAVTACLCFTAACSMTLVYQLELGGKLGPTWQTAAALAAAYAGAVVIGGVHSWRWLRVVAAAVFVLMFLVATPVHDRLSKQHDRDEFAALGFPLLVPRMPGFEIHFASARSGTLDVWLRPTDRQVSPSDEYLYDVMVLVRRPPPDLFPTAGLPTLAQVAKLWFGDTSCSQYAPDVWQCTQNRPPSTMVVVRRDGVLVQLTAQAVAATPEQLLNAASTLYEADPAELAAVNPSAAVA
jgi:hypothetical protein